MLNYTKHLSIFILVIAVISLSYAQAKFKGSRPKEVKTVTFTNLDGKAVTAKILSQDRDYLTLSYPKDGSIITETVRRDMLLADSMVYHDISIFDYYNQLGDYFTASTWDFKNDGEDFIQAQRCYEKARDIVIELKGQDHMLVKQLNDKIQDLIADSKKWQDTAAKRAKFNELEFKASLNDRLTKMQDQLDNNRIGVEVIKKQIADLDQLSNNISKMQQRIDDELGPISRDLDRIKRDIDDNSMQIRQLWRSYNHIYYYRPVRKTYCPAKNDSNN